MKSDHQIRVEIFMKHAGQEVKSYPAEPITEFRALRARLILEEAIETVYALGFEVRIKGFVSPIDHTHLELFDSFVGFDLLKVVDGCCDLKVVTTGTLSACGVADEEVQWIVDEANLRKICPGATQREDGKWVKPPDFIGPEEELRKEIERQKTGTFQL